MRRPHAVTHRAVRSVLAYTAIALLTACATGLESLPLPAHTSTGGSTYSLTAAFGNALNLPAKAKVKLNGADIGEVESIRARDFTAYVTMSIASSVPLYVGSRAELRSATPLGDVFVAIKPNSDEPPNAERLHDGDLIPLDSTSAAATVEEVLTSAALLVNGGAVRRFVNVLNGSGAAVGEQGSSIATLLNESSALLSRLNQRSGQIRTALQNTSELAAALSAQQNTLNAVLEASAPATAVIADNTAQLADLVDTVGRITGQLSRFPSLQGTDTRSLIADINELSRAFNDVAVDPNISLTAMNKLIPIFMKNTNSAALHGSGTFVRLALGNHPDNNYPGDPGFHGPDGTDWHAMVGGFRYQWNILLNQIFGPNR